MQLRTQQQKRCLLLQIHAHNLQPALQWVEEHRQELQQQPQAAGFEFKLYRLSFLHTLQQHGIACTSRMRTYCSSATVTPSELSCSNVKSWNSIQPCEQMHIKQ